jgi:hypothetical protein
VLGGSPLQKIGGRPRPGFLARHAPGLPQFDQLVEGTAGHLPIGASSTSRACTTRRQLTPLTRGAGRPGTQKRRVGQTTDRRGAGTFGTGYPRWCGNADHHRRVPTYVGLPRKKSPAECRYRIVGDHRVRSRGRAHVPGGSQKAPGGCPGLFLATACCGRSEARPNRGAPAEAIVEASRHFMRLQIESGPQRGAW